MSAARILVPLAPGWRAAWIDGKRAAIEPAPALVWDPEHDCAYAVTWDGGAWQVADGGSYRPPDTWLAPGEDDEEILEDLEHAVSEIRRTR